MKRFAAVILGIALAVMPSLAEEKESGRLDELAGRYIYRYILTEEEEVPAA